jgi:hypothetical protein
VLAHGRRKKSQKNLSRPGFEPGSTAWQAAILPLDQRDAFLEFVPPKWPSRTQAHLRLCLESTPHDDAAVSGATARDGRVVINDAKRPHNIAVALELLDEPVRLGVPRVHRVVVGRAENVALGSNQAVEAIAVKAPFATKGDLFVCCRIPYL